jgi:hypothetical protein
MKGFETARHLTRDNYFIDLEDIYFIGYFNVFFMKSVPMCSTRIDSFL